MGKVRINVSTKISTPFGSFLHACEEHRLKEWDMQPTTIILCACSFHKIL